MLTTTEAAALLGLKYAQVSKLARQGRLTARPATPAEQVELLAAGRIKAITHTRPVLIDPASVEHYAATPHKRGWPAGKGRK